MLFLAGRPVFVRLGSAHVIASSSMRKEKVTDTGWLRRFPVPRKSVAQGKANMEITSQVPSCTSNAVPGFLPGLQCVLIAGWRAAERRSDETVVVCRQTGGSTTQLHWGGGSVLHPNRSALRTICQLPR